MNDLLQLKIVSPKEEIFSGEVLSVSSVNSQGPFDILAEHANFITVVEKQPIIVRKSSKEKSEFNFDIAIIVNLKNLVTIYTEIPISPNSAS